MTTPAPIEDLRLASRFVSELPGDPSRENRSRPVQGACYSHVSPTPVAAPTLLALVPEVAALLDLDATPSPQLTEVLAGNRVLPGMVPYAACYGGHQFGHWAGQLGDGRAITLGEVENARGERWEMQLKGAGRTPYSRNADGRAVLRSSLRELACSEAMHHLGVPTTRALSLVMTGEPVLRDMLYDGNARHEPGAIVCRVAPSFLRFGNYQIHASRGDVDTLRTLVRFTLQHHYPQHLHGDEMDIVGFFAEVSARTALMIAHWMRVGFVHGVMNTDNMSILGLTIDYGPYGWMDVFDPDFTPNTTDAEGRRYRFGYQPRIAHWNVVQLANALAPLVNDVSALQDAVDRYPQTLALEQRSLFLAKLGLHALPDHDALDDELLSALFALLAARETDMTLFFRALATLRFDDAQLDVDASLGLLADTYYAPDAPSEHAQATARWLQRYRARSLEEGVSDAARSARMNAHNPLYVPRNYLVQEVIDKVEAGDTAALGELLEVLRHPYEAQPGKEAFARKRPDWARHRAGCSMLSCSS
jgi:serine/tyrosine/threonine adenylyltransferase